MKPTETSPQPAAFKKLTAVKGMNDILPGDSAKWEWLEATVRGLMARYAITHRAKTPADLLGFDVEGYAYDAAVSEPDRLVFRRRLEA